MSVKYPEFKELTKKSTFNWLLESEGENPYKNVSIIRLDLFNQCRMGSISNEMKKAILTLVEKYVKERPYTNVVINAELQKVFDRDSERKPRMEIYYIISVTVKKINGKDCNLNNTMEIHNVKGSGRLYINCKNYAYDSLKQFILK